MWTIDQLKSKLSSSQGVKGWVIHEEHVHRRERYFMTDRSALVTDQDRDVHSQNVEVTIYVKLDKPGRQGEITQKFFKALPLPAQLDAAIEAARQTDHQAWELPSEIPSKLPQLASADPRLGEDLERVMGEMTGKIEKAVGRRRDTTFNSAELFLSVHDRTLHLSTGLTHRYSQSRIYSEAAYSYAKRLSSGETVADEYLNSRWAVSMDEFDIEKLFDETSDRAQASLDVEKPQTGKYPVIVDSEVLALLFNDHLTHLTARNSYLGLPFSSPGTELIAGATGDLLDITLDPHLEHGADTVAVSSQGVVQTPLRLVERNKVVATSADKQHADYLAIPVSAVRGSVVVGAGKLTYEELKKQGPQVIEILQFSALFADPNSGTFSSEIRLARLYDNENGTVKYLKGGSLSGSIGENFKGARFSNRRTKRAHFTSNSLTGHGYYGPEYALLSDVSIVG